MELRSAEGTIQDLLVVYDTNIRGSAAAVAHWAAATPNPPQHPELLVPAIPPELLPASWVDLVVSKANTTNNDAADDEKETETAAFAQSLFTTQKVLTSHKLAATIFKLQKRLYELDPVTEKGRLGPSSQHRVKVLIGQYNFLCAQYLQQPPDFIRLQQQQQLKHYHQEQLQFQQQRQAQRRREHSQNMQEQNEKELERKKEEEEKEGKNEAMEETTETQETEMEKEETLPYTLAANRNPDGSIRMETLQQTGTTNSNTIPYFVSVMEEEDNTNNNPHVASLSSSSPTSLFFREVQQHYKHKQLTEQRQAELEHTAKLQQEQEVQRRYDEEQRKEKSMKEQQLRLQKEAEARKQQRLHDQAERVRVQRREDDERRKQAERDWLQNIRKGLPGVQYYLDIVLQRRSVDDGEENAEGTPPATHDATNNSITSSSLDPLRVKAVRSLCTLFEQIQKHPEEVNHRKIKLTNTNFQTDIGRHYGAIQLLIAAGFRPTMLASASATEINSGSSSGSSSGATTNNNDEEEQQEEPTLSSATVAAVAAAGAAAAAAIDINADPDNNTNNIAFLISKEPNLEHDMDGWMIWFDLNKATLELLQNELAAIDKK